MGVVNLFLPMVRWYAPRVREAGFSEEKARKILNAAN
jgi:hypothetical protein